MKILERDFTGYGKEPPNPNWPKKSKLAINFIINVEEGSEYSPLLGDLKSESGLSEVPGGRHNQNQRDLAIESIYEYGSRVGFWRIAKLLDNYKLPHTFFVCALTLLQNKEICEHIKYSSNDICCHGYKWEEHYKLNKITEKKQIKKAYDLILIKVGTVGMHQAKILENCLFKMGIFYMIVTHIMMICLIGLRLEEKNI